MGRFGFIPNKLSRQLLIVKGENNYYLFFSGCEDRDGGMCELIDNALINYYFVKK